MHLVALGTAVSLSAVRADPADEGPSLGTVLNDPGGEVAKEGDYYYPYDYAAEEQ